jgi:hypothetical protein
MSRYLYVDWENIWIGLRCLGYSVAPSAAVTALVQAAFGDAHDGVHVVIVTRSRMPTETERSDIRQAVLTRTGVAADIRTLQNNKDGAADIELAFWVGRRTWDSEATELVIASSDADLADVARLARQVQPNQPVTLAYLGRADQKAPTPGRYRLLDVLTQPGIGLPPPVESSRSATEFDRAAWALALSLNAVPHTNEARARHPDDAPPPLPNQKYSTPPLWWARAKNPQPDLQTLHDVDHVLWEVQRFLKPARHLVAGLDEAAQLLRAKFTQFGWAALAGDVEAILRALATVDLLRLDSHGNLLYRPTLREGVLLPVRRAILIMLVAPGPAVTSRYLQDRHLRRKYPDVSPDEAAESFKYAKNALTSQWKIARAERDKLMWANRKHQLVVDTEGKGRAIQRVVQKDMTQQDIAAAVGAAWFHERWLRVLADAKILRHNHGDKTWGPGDCRL